MYRIHIVINTLTTPVTSTNPYEVLYQNISEQVSEVSATLNETSKEKYDKKITLIENAQDMTTKEKLDAIDKCYDRRTQESWQNILHLARVSALIIGLAAGSPAAIKSFKRLIA